MGFLGCVLIQLFDYYKDGKSRHREGKVKTQEDYPQANKEVLEEISLPDTLILDSASRTVKTWNICFLSYLEASTVLCCESPGR